MICACGSLKSKRVFIVKYVVTMDTNNIVMQYCGFQFVRNKNVKDFALAAF